MPPWMIIITITLSALMITAISGEPAAKITITPSTRQKPGGDARIICKVDPKWNTNTVQWWRKVGSVQTKIGSNSIISADFSNGNRYQSVGYGGDDGSGYSLTISNVRYEDSASIGCSVRGSDEDPSYVNLAVCDDVENQACLCVAQTGWNSPACFAKDPSIAAWENRYTSATSGLGVCLAIAIVYGLVMSVLAGWDCMGRMAAKRKRQQELAEMRKSHDPAMYAGSEEVELDPNDSMSQVKLTTASSAARPRHHEKSNGYNQITTKAVAHTNRAYNPEDEDTGYVEIDDDDDDRRPPKYNGYKSHSSAPPRPSAPTGGRRAGAVSNDPLPEPRAIDQYYSDRFGNDIRSPGVPRTPHDALQQHPENTGRSPGAWSTQSAAAAGPAPGAFRYPEVTPTPNSQPPHAGMQSGRYGNGDISPRYAQPSPRNAYSERPPARSNVSNGAPGGVRESNQQHLQPRALFNQQYPTEGGASRASPLQRPHQYGNNDNVDDDDYDDRYSAHPGGGAYMDKSGLAV